MPPGAPSLRLPRIAAWLARLLRSPAARARLRARYCRSCPALSLNAHAGGAPRVTLRRRHEAGGPSSGGSAPCGERRDGVGRPRGLGQERVGVPSVPLVVRVRGLRVEAEGVCEASSQGAWLDDRPCGLVSPGTEDVARVAVDGDGVEQGRELVGEVREGVVRHLADEVRRHHGRGAQPLDERVGELARIDERPGDAFQPPEHEAPGLHLFALLLEPREQRGRERTGVVRRDEDLRFCLHGIAPFELFLRVVEERVVGRGGASGAALAGAEAVEAAGAPPSSSCRPASALQARGPPCYAARAVGLS